MSESAEIRAIILVARHFPNSKMQSAEWCWNNGILSSVEFHDNCDYCHQYRPCLWAWDEQGFGEAVACAICRVQQGLRPVTLKVLAE